MNITLLINNIFAYTTNDKQLMKYINEQTLCISNYNEAIMNIFILYNYMICICFCTSLMFL